jgi:hypothetical protein
LWVIEDIGVGWMEVRKGLGEGGGIILLEDILRRREGFGGDGGGGDDDDGVLDDDVDGVLVDDNVSALPSSFINDNGVYVNNGMLLFDLMNLPCCDSKR